MDVIGLRGQVKSSVQVEPPPLKPLRSSSSSPLHQIRHELPPELAAYVDSSDVWDVFISHASEDKEAVAEPLAEELTARGVKVWLDKTELRIGDSLRRKIDAGLAKSRFGVVVLSRSFFAKGWPQYELDGIVSRSISGEQTLLPLWHEITKTEVQQYSPSLVDKIARSTAQFTIDEIADEIAEVVGPSDNDANDAAS
ncbi:MAG TPA: toll/interleukin-1 receptor domain-containing protein [Propionibacteriaceae bacterium]|nr:toll/interleukin-1 receptor domain-containing protein [Propionibacteriaceae bacterium]